MTPEDLAELERLAACATPAALADAAEEGACVRCDSGMYVDDGHEWPDDGLCHNCALEDADRLRVAVPKLCAEVRRLQAIAEPPPQKYRECCGGGFRARHCEGCPDCLPVP